MKRLTGILLTLLLLSGCGSEVAVPEKPQRVACLMGSFAQVWMLAGGQAVAAADDAWEDYHLDLQPETARLGTIKKPNLEALLEARPDLVLGSSATPGQVALKETLDAAGIASVWFDVQNFEDYLALLKFCTDLTGRPDLYETNGLEVQAQIGEAMAAAKGHAPPRVLYLRLTSTGVRAKGSEGTVLGEMLADLGCENIADGGSLETLSLEYIRSADPEFIFCTPMGDEEKARATMDAFFAENPLLAELTAVKEGRVYLLDKALYHMKPNARWGEAYQRLEALLYGP